VNNKNNNWETISSEIVHKNSWYSIQKDDVKLPNGDGGEYFIVKTDTNASVFIVPIKDDKIIFVRQYRYVFDEWFIELPGGAVDMGETFETAAIKELREEAGYVADAMKEIGTFIPLSGAVDEVSHVFVARDLQFVGQELEATEDGAEIVEIAITDAYKMIENGEIIDGQTITALILAKKIFKKCNPLHTKNK